jgi:hypothetical protein
MANVQPRVDHVVLDTRDGIDAAADVYRSLGFRLTERGRHTLGSINRLAVFESDYLELLGFDSAAGAPRADIAQFPAGLNGLVFATESAESLFRDLTARDIPMEEPQAFSRPVVLPDGVHDARFCVARLRKGAAPFGRMYFCQHLTPDLVWRPEWRQHPNGAAGLARVSIAARAPAVSAELFLRLFGRDNVREASGGAWNVTAGAVPIEVVPLDILQRQLGDAMPIASGRSDFIARIGIRTAALSRASEALRSAAIPFQVLEAGRILVPASAARNVAIEFVEGRS